MQKYYKLKDQRFLSTPSARRATQDQIHHLWRGGHFYPRPPRGGRRKDDPEKLQNFVFLSTPSARRATSGFQFCRGRTGISIHALREEGDPSQGHGQRQPSDFYPRPPRGGRRLAHGNCFTAHLYFYPRPPRGGRRCHVSRQSGFRRISIHALREEGDSFQQVFNRQKGNISIHALREEGDNKRTIGSICKH